MNPIVVSAAIIRKEGKILLAQRAKGSHLENKWEFPGGKVEKNETPQDCLKRELKEELGVDCRIGNLFMETQHDYGDKLIHLIFFEAEIAEGIPFPIVHQKLEWIKPEDLGKYDMPEADVRVIEKLMSDL